MTMSSQATEIAVNPFSVKTPENLAARELVDLFVPYPEFSNLQVSGHQFLHGHRGSGKSMMLRMMCPDSQTIVRHCEVSELPYFGVYLSIKATELNAPEYIRLMQEVSGTVLSEHVLTTKMLSALLQAIRSNCAASLHTHQRLVSLQNFVLESFYSKLKYAGWDSDPPVRSDSKLASVEQVLNHAIDLIDQVHTNTTQYIKRRSFGQAVPYQGVLLGFQDVLVPLVQALADREITPKAPVYFLLDDADNLTEQQTQVLNTWVSYRMTGQLSLKISTQLNYKTYKTTSGIHIESPHDFSEINFTSVHTGSHKERYPKLIADIVRKRLVKHGSTTTDPYDFFPDDEGQKAAIQQIADEYKALWTQGKSGAYRGADDAYRYARPEYMKRLSGPSKQGARYKYAGFEQLVHVSSGIVRFFLEPAARMFTDQQLKNSGSPVTHISPAIQDQELRHHADQLLLNDFEKLQLEASDSNGDSSEGTLEEIQKLRNVVFGVGALFRAHILDSNATQRRVFSFSISDEEDKEIAAVLKLGVIHGYFYRDSIGSKSGFGRKPLYVLTRRLAPAFSLDPMGFSGYLTLTSGTLKEIAARPNSFVNRLRKTGLSVIDESKQLSLLDGENNA
jgi:hypothetical protein